MGQCAHLPRRRGDHPQTFPGVSETAGTPQPDDNVRENGLFIEFLQQLQADCIAEQMRFLRNELKLKALITDLNHQFQFTLAGITFQAGSGG